MKRILELCFTGIEQLLKVSLYHTISICLFLEEQLMSDSVFIKWGRREKLICGKEGKAYLFLFSISYMSLVAVFSTGIAVCLQSQAILRSWRVKRTKHKYSFSLVILYVVIEQYYEEQIYWLLLKKKKDPLWTIDLPLKILVLVISKKCNFLFKASKARWSKM